MTGWNLPPGVTGNEDAFGPAAETEFEEERACGVDGCSFKGLVIVTAITWRYDVSFNWDCPKCGADHPSEVAIDDLRFDADFDN